MKLGRSISHNREKPADTGTKSDWATKGMNKGGEDLGGLHDGTEVLLAGYE
jgi:hypothetical protein